MFSFSSSILVFLGATLSVGEVVTLFFFKEFCQFLLRRCQGCHYPSSCLLNPSYSPPLLFVYHENQRCAERLHHLNSFDLFSTLSTLCHQTHKASRVVGPDHCGDILGGGEVLLPFRIKSTSTNSGLFLIAFFCAFIRMAGIRGSVGGACINNFTFFLCLLRML